MDRAEALRVLAATGGAPTTEELDAIMEAGAEPTKRRYVVSVQYRVPVWRHVLVEASAAHEALRIARDYHAASSNFWNDAAPDHDNAEPTEFAVEGDFAIGEMDPNSWTIHHDLTKAEG